MDLATLLLSQDTSLRVFDGIASLLSIKDIMALTRTCRAFSSLYHNMIHDPNGAWNIDRRLQKFFADPRGFRKELKRADGVISGGFALQFFDRVEWSGSDLDICVQVGDKAQQLAAYLEKVEGYDLAARKVGGYGWVNNVMIYQYDKVEKGKFVRLELVLTLKHPIIATLSTYTTALVTAITSDYAFCVFPHASFVNRRTFPTRVPDEFNGVVLPRKYKERGWKFTQRLPREGEVTQELDLRHHRRIGDRFTWKMAFPAVDEVAMGERKVIVDGLEFTMTTHEDMGLEVEWMSLTATQEL